MKLGRTSWMILLAGLFIVVIASLGMARSQQSSAQSQLSSELGIANARIENLQISHLVEQEQDLRQRLDESRELLEESKDRLRNDTLNSIDVTDELFKIAKSCNVEVVSVSSAGHTQQELAEVVCESIPFSGTVAGSVPDLVKFIHKVNTDYKTGVIKDAIIVTVDTESGMPEANIRVIAYTYEGE